MLLLFTSPVQKILEQEEMYLSSLTNIFWGSGGVPALRIIKHRAAIQRRTVAALTKRTGGGGGVRAVSLVKHMWVLGDLDFGPFFLASSLQQVQFKVSILISDFRC